MLNIFRGGLSVLYIGVIRYFGYTQRRGFFPNTRQLCRGHRVIVVRASRDFTTNQKTLQIEETELKTRDRITSNQFYIVPPQTNVRLIRWSVNETNFPYLKRTT